MKSNETLPIIGWVEYVEFPDWGIRGIKCKTDTGARTSALHVENLTKKANGTIEFDVVVNRRRPFRLQRVKATSAKRRRVRSSNGLYEIRHFITTRIRIGGWEREIEISLVSRSDMVFRMLLGRKALERQLLVDPARRNLLAPRLRRRKSRLNEPL